MATIRDVARAAGVSTATVSRYLAGTRVRTADAITQAIERLGYQPSDLARALRSGRHGSIALIVPDVSNPFFAAVAKGVENEARAAGLRVLLGNSNEDAQLEDELVDALAKSADGLILAPVVEEGRSESTLLNLDAPVVLVDRQVHDEDGFDRVMADNAGGIRLAVDHLVALGHTRIATISGPLYSTPGRARHEAFVASTAAHGLTVPAEYLEFGDFREEGGRAAAARLLGLRRPPTAIVVANNLMTFGALHALQIAGTRVPADVSVIGFDDHALAPLLQPPLTVIRRDEEAQGAYAAELLLRRISGDAPETGHQALTLPVELVVRESTARPRPEQEVQS